MRKSVTFLMGILSFFLLLSLGAQGAAFSQPARVEKNDLVRLLLTRVQGADGIVAMNILQNTFEAKPRGIHTKKYGMAFPLQPEVILPVLQDIQGKAVLEIAAATGTNAILLGLAGAGSVHINDIDEKELEIGKNMVSELTAEQQNKFTFVAGDCFTAFAQDDYTEKFDVIVARNIFHFFLDDDREKFIALLHRLLKPEGQLIISVNAARLLVSQEEIDAQPDCYTFKQQLLMLRGDGLNNIPFHRQVVFNPSNTGFDPFGYKFTEVAKFGSNLSNYEALTAFSSLSPKQIEYLEGYYASQIGPKFGYYKSLNASFSIHESYSIAYTEKLLLEALAPRFSPTLLATIAADGHITGERDKSNFLAGIFSKK